MNAVGGGIAMLLAFGGCVCCYLASPHQRWRVAPVALRPALAMGALLSIASLYTFADTMDAVPATFTFISWAMLLLAAFPYLGALRSILRRGL